MTSRGVDSDWRRAGLVERVSGCSEIVQVGRIPIYLYDDIAWLPYKGGGGEFSPDSISVLGQYRT